jgi:alkaline phosphatase D
VQVILLDLRYNRTPLVRQEPGARNYRSWAWARHRKGLEVPGPYARNPDPEATMLGERQWQWLEQQLETPAEVRLIGSSLQVLADFPGWEGWSLFAHDQQRLIELIRRRRANGVIFLSGDMHYAELSKLDVNVPYTLWDLTSSGLTEVWPAATPNANRVSDVIREPNFGLIEIDWQGAQTTVTLSVMDQRGTRRIEKRLPLAELSAWPVDRP